MNSSLHTHYNRVLSNVSVEFKVPGFVAEKIVPRQKVENETDVYYEFDRSHFRPAETLRADGTQENLATGGWITRPYMIEAHGLRDYITKRMRQNADPGLDLDVSVTHRLTELLKLDLELRVVGPNGLIRTAGNNAGSVNANWTDYTTASPRDTVNTGISVVQASAGVQPNTLVASPETLRKMTQIAEYREEYKYVTDIRNTDLPTKLYGLDVVVAEGLYDTSVKGEAPSLSYIMGGDIWIGYVKKGGLGVRDLTYATLFYTEQYTRKFYDDDIESDVIAVNDNYDPRLIARECGYLIQSPFTA